MAKYAKKRSPAKKKTTRRRKRMSGIADVDGQAIALAIGGAVAASKIEQMLAKDPTKTTMVKIAPYAALGLGVLIPMFVKNPMAKQVALGLAAMGGLSALKKLAPGMVGQIPGMINVVSSTSNSYRTMPKPIMNGVGYPLSRNSVFQNAMSVVNGIGSSADGSGSSYTY